MGNLVQVESTGKYVIKYIHNPDKMISYERFSSSSSNQIVKEYHGILTVENGNLTYDERIFDNVEEGLIVKTVGLSNMIKKLIQCLVF